MPLLWIHSSACLICRQHDIYEAKRNQYYVDHPDYASQSDRDSDCEFIKTEKDKKQREQKKSVQAAAAKKRCNKNTTLSFANAEDDSIALPAAAMTSSPKEAVVHIAGMVKDSTDVYALPQSQSLHCSSSDLCTLVVSGVTTSSASSDDIPTKRQKTESMPSTSVDVNTTSASSWLPAFRW